LGIGYGNEITFSTQTLDIDNNTYEGITIGNQIWMKQNLKTKHFRNGDTIANVTNNSDWYYLQTAAYCNYNNDSNVAMVYGKLYNYYVLADSRFLCPNGWRVPTNADWTELTTYLGGETIAGGKLKEIGTTHWTSPNTAINSVAFTALPGGNRNNTGGFSSLGTKGYWWSSSIDSATGNILIRGMNYNNDTVDKLIKQKNNAYSLRCIKGKTLATIKTQSATNIGITNAISGGIVSTDGGSAIISRGVCWNNKKNPTIINNLTTDGTGLGTFSSNLTGLVSNTLYYVRAYATNSIGTVYGNEIIFSTKIFDVDSNIYDAVTIGEQIWLKQNLKTTRFNNGDTIPNLITYNSWSFATSSGYCNYNDDTSNSTIYGRLYNYYAVADYRNLCPSGWHVPSVYDWYTLKNYLYDSIADKIKEVGISHWPSPNTATNESGFTALPGGIRLYGGTYSDIGFGGSWWSFNEIYHNPENYATSMYLYNSNNNLLSGGGGGKRAGLSVRCVKNQLKIGETYQGGVIAYILQPDDPGYDSTVTHGLIVPTFDQGSLYWGCNTISISGANGTALGTGNQNSIAIMNGCSETNIAAKVCKSLVLNGYNDWYLPSKDELDKLRLNQFQIGGMTTGYYWSSSEATSNNAWIQCFILGTQFGQQSGNVKNNTKYVRAMRSF